VKKVYIPQYSAKAGFGFSVDSHPALNDRSNILSLYGWAWLPIACVYLYLV